MKQVSRTPSAGGRASVAGKLALRLVVLVSSLGWGWEVLAVVLSLVVPGSLLESGPSSLSERIRVATGNACYAADADIVISEIYYNPISRDANDEYLELYNRGPTTVDLSSWIFSRGITYVVPEGTFLAPKEALLFSPDPTRTRSTYGVDRVLGPYSGNLDDGGEVLILLSSSGREIQRTHYEDGGAWPSQADGQGSSLEIRDPVLVPEVPRNWRASWSYRGTPGFVEAPVDRSASTLTLVELGDEWAYLAGDSPFPDGWQDLDFDDSAWNRGPTGIGFGDDDDATEIPEMEGSYLSIAARHEFTIDEALLAGELELTLEIDYDDGFLGRINGVEVARGNLGSPGDETPHDQGADEQHEAGDVETFTLNASTLRPGRNVLAFQAHNQNIDSGDLSFRPRLLLRSVPSSERYTAPALRINEVAENAGASDAWIELFNAGDTPVDTSRLVLTDSLGNRASLAGRAPGNTLDPANFLVVTAAQLGFSIALAGKNYSLIEEIDDREFIVDSINPRDGPGSTVDGLSYGRVPDGDNDDFLLDQPTRGAANEEPATTPLVVSEIYYHPPFVAPNGDCEGDCSDDDQWLEIYNPNDSEVALEGWSLTKAVRFDFEAGMTIGARNYVVVAASRDAFLAANPQAPPARVYGDWSRALSHSSDTINLRNPAGNLVDHVRYGDGGPTNDESPNDGVDDRTILVSEWPAESEGTGRTIELVHHDLNNRHGHSWSTGSVGGTPAAQNDAFDSSPPAVIGSVNHSPALPEVGDEVIVTCRVSHVTSLDFVDLIWRVDGAGGTNRVSMRDDGAGPDAVAGDGRFAGIIPPQSDGDVIAFQIEADVTSAPATLLPKQPENPPYNGFEGPFFLYQVFARNTPDNPSETYHIIQTAEDRDELGDRSIRSNVLLPATFIAELNDGTTFVRHLVGLRYRGSNARRANRKSYRVSFAADRPFIDIRRLNLNAQSTENELLSLDLFRRAGIAAPLAWSVNLWLNDDLDTRYIRKERLDDDFLDRYFGGAQARGNLYRAIDPDEGGFPFQGDLSYFGEDPDDYRPYYFKESNEEEDDYSDIIELTRAIDEDETPDEEFVERLSAIADVRQWARFFAVQSAITNADGTISNRTGEDYNLYRVPIGAGGPSSGKWVLIPWDVEETFTDEDERLFRPDIDNVRRFLTNQAFAPLYYTGLIDIRHGAFSRRETRQRFRLIDFNFPFSTIDDIDAYITARLGFYDENVPMSLQTGTQNSSGSAIVPVGSVWTYFPGSSEPSGGDTSWTELDFDDGDWDSGPSGFGYGDGDDNTILGMRNNYTTLYIRKEFDVANPEAIGTSLRLRMDYDDGFVAYLNGVEVARSGLEGDPPANDATAPPHEAGDPEIFDISESAGLLREGRNVLAIHGANSRIDSADFSMIPSLEVGASVSAGCGDLIFASGPILSLEGRSNACETSYVRVDGERFEFNAFQATWTGSTEIGPGENEVVIEAFDVANNLLDSQTLTVRGVSGGFTQLGGTLNGNQTLTAEDSPYLMTSDVVIPGSGRLDVGPGVIVFVQDDHRFQIRGELTIAGQEGAEATFLAERCGSRWEGILFDDTGTGGGDFEHTIRHAVFGHGTGTPGFLNPVDSKLRIESSRFEDLTSNAVDAMDSEVDVESCVFVDIHEGVHGTNSTVRIRDSHFEGMIGDKDAIDFDGDGDDRSLIEGCFFLNGSDDGIDLGRVSVDIRDNIFIGVQDKALSLEGNGTVGDGRPTITGNTIYACGTAVALKNGVRVEEAHNNTIVGNQEGLSFFAKDDANDGGHGTFHSNIVWDNIVDVRVDALSSLDLSYSNVSARVWPGEGNISSEPRFRNVDEEDFRLRSGSPCISTGRDGSDMGAFPFDGDRILFIRGDADRDGELRLTDAVFALEFLFRGGAEPPCLDAVDTNDDGTADLSDSIYLLLYLFASGDAPPAPFPSPGTDVTDDDLRCEEDPEE
ncbi:MAG: lamin tail domain-containing protein [Planctomycetota bacterium]